MQHIGIVLHLFLSLVILVHQIVILADNLEAGFLFPCNVQPVTGYPGTLDDKPFKKDAQHFFLKAVRNGEFVFHGYGDIVQLPRTRWDEPLKRKPLHDTSWSLP